MQVGRGVGVGASTVGRVFSAVADQPAVQALHPLPQQLFVLSRLSLSLSRPLAFSPSRSLALSLSRPLARLDG